MPDPSLSDISSSDLLELVQELLTRSGRGLTPAQMARDLADDLYQHVGVSVVGTWVESDGDWKPLFRDDPDCQPPDRPGQMTDTMLEMSGKFWWGIPGPGTAPSGMIALEGSNSAQARTVYEEVLPAFRVYFQEIHEETDVTEHELVEFEEDLSPDFEKARRSRNLDEVLETLTKTVARLFECDHCRLFWLEGGDRLRLRAESNPSGDPGIEISVDEDPIIQSVIQDEKSIIINNLPDHDENRRSSGNIRSFLSVPFRSGDRVQGTLNLSSEDEGVFTRDQLQQLSAVADNFGFIYQTTRELANLTEYVEKILANLPVGVLNVEPERDSVHINEMAQTILNIPREQLERDEFRSQLREAGAEPLLEFLDSDLSQGETSRREFRLEREGAFPRTIAAFASSIREVEGDANRLVIVLNDVTDQRILSEQVNRTERLSALGELAAGLAHEIKNPLTSIQGFVQLLSKRSDDEEFVVKTSEVIERESRRLNSLVENLVSFGKPQVGSRRLFSLGDLMDDVEMLVQKKMEKRNVEFTRSCPSSLEIYGDAQKIKQVLINLILNAIDAIEDGGEVTVTARKDNQEFTFIEVEDDGVGIDPDLQDKVINPFYTTKEEGTGLGLAISHRIVEEHGGTLSFESEPGEGTTVELTVPPRHLQDELSQQDRIEQRIHRNAQEESK